MPPRPAIDPARLEGRALDRWYRRTPDEVQSERDAAEQRRYEAFFGGGRTSKEPAPRHSQEVRYEPAATADDDTFG